MHTLVHYWSKQDDEVDMTMMMTGVILTVVVKSHYEQCPPSLPIAPRSAYAPRSTAGVAVAY